MKYVFMVVFLLMSLIVWNGCGSGEANSKDKNSGPDSTVADSTASGQPGKTGAGPRGKKGENISAVPVEVTRLSIGDISSSLLYSSTLETEETVDVYSRIGGLVMEVYAEESQQIQKGQKLLQIEKEEYELAEEKARLEYKTKLADFKRLKALQEEDLLSQEEFDNAELALKQTEIAWKQAALNLKYTTITAPITGVIGDRFVRLGDRIQPSTKLYTITNLDEKIVRIYVPQGEFTKCYLKQRAVITSDVIEGERLDGYVKRISPVIDPQSGTFKVTVAVNDPQNRLRPGMFVNTELIVDTHENTRLIPKSALLYENERTYFFIVSEDSARKIEMQKGFEDAEKVEVLNDLPAGTQVVVLGQNGLKNGSKVRIIVERSYPWQQKEGAPLSEVRR